MTTDAEHHEEPDADSVEWIIEELREGMGKLPEAAIRAARESRALVVPRLIQAIEEAVAEWRSGDKPVGHTHFFALYLLAEFRAKEAWPAILEAISLPGEGPFDLFGGAITADLARILLILAPGGIELLDSMIRNRDLNEYVRWEAVQAFCLLVRDGSLPREEAVERLTAHLREAIDGEDAQIVTKLVSTLCRLYPAKAVETIQEAFERGMVETFMVGWPDVERAIAHGEAGFRKWQSFLEPTSIYDTIAYLRTWHSFAPTPPKRIIEPPEPATLAWADDDPLADLPESSPPRARRNDPCPCGSGKKYKKCCGAPNKPSPR